MSSLDNKLKLLAVGFSADVTVTIKKLLSARTAECSFVSSESEIEFLASDITAVFVWVDRYNPSVGLDHIEAMAQREVPTIAIFESRCKDLFVRSIEAGAIDVLDLPLTSSLIEDALDTAIFRKQIQHHRVSMVAHAKQLETLSPRERRIVQLAADGMPNKQIASSVDLSVKSIERIRREAYRKLGVRSTAEMTRVYLLGSLYSHLNFATPTVPTYAGAVEV